MQSTILAAALSSAISTPSAVDPVALKAPQRAPRRAVKETDPTAGMVSADFTTLRAVEVYAMDSFMRAEYRRAIGRELVRAHGLRSRLIALSMLAAYCDYGASKEGRTAALENLPEGDKKYAGDWWASFCRCMSHPEGGDIVALESFSALPKLFPAGKGKSVEGGRVRGKGAQSAATDGETDDDATDGAADAPADASALVADVAALSAEKARLEADIALLRAERERIAADVFALLPDECELSAAVADALARAGQMVEVEAAA